MNQPLLLSLLGLLYIVVLGGLSLLRREGLSIRFAVESLLITMLAAALALLGGLAIHPVVFLILLYLVTMRVRLLVDIGNSLAGRGKIDAGQRIYRLAEQVGPDPAGLTVIQLNQAVALLQKGALDEAILRFRAILAQFAEPHAATGISVKHEAACYYNMGVAYQRQGQSPQAVEAFQHVLEVWPVSEYARHAARILKAYQKDTGPRAEQNQ